MRMMTIGMTIFLIAIGAATFYESAYDIQTARLLIYNSLWFEVLLGYMGIGLIANIIEHRMFRREKISVLAFHLSFIIILLGSWVTRYVSFDGLMMIREGEKSNFIYSSDPYLWFKVNDGKMQYVDSRKLFMSEITNNDFDIDVNFPKHKTPVKIEYVDFQKKMIDTLIINDSIKTMALDIITDGMKSNYLSENGFLMVGEVALSFDKKDAMPGIHISVVDGKMMMTSKIPLKFLPMSEMQKARQSGKPIDEKLYVHVPVDSIVPFRTTTLYLVNGQQFVFKQVLKHAKMMKMPSGKRKVGSDFLVVKITDGNQSKIVELEGGMGAIPTHETFNFGGLTYEMEYGSTKLELPFSIACKDFQLDKYPGSETASSFASEVTVLDEKNKHKHDQRIFMNNVMDYNGYRFFQSAYDLDNPSTPENEEGTRLSVNHDWWGTNITYLGYLLMSIGMLMSLFAKNSRFKELNEKLKKTRERREGLMSLLIIIALTFGGVSTSFGQHNHNHEAHNHASHQVSKKKEKPVFRVMSKEHAENLESLLVQDFDGRIVPMHTTCDQLLRKIYRNNKFEEWNAVQTIMSMHMYPEHWMDVKIIQVPSNLRDRFQVGEFSSFKELATEQGEFKWMKEYDAAHKKSDAKKDEFDKKIIKLVEKFQVVQAIFAWQYMKIIPVKSDANQKWFVPLSMDLMKVDSTSSMSALKYLSTLDKACKENQYGQADDILAQLKAFQRKAGEKVAPSEAKIKVEISYNKMTIFKNTWYSYITIGFILLVIFFIRIFVTPSAQTEKRFSMIGKIMTGLLIIMFVYHGVGLGFRWFITGHAPWSNGYGAIVFIAWVTMIAGFAFARKNPVILAGTAILAALMIFVSEMNLMDPEITPIQPVLKSYWLMIHVSIITGSYGFLGLACILSLLNLILYITRNEKNGKVVTLNITELTYVSEMTTTVGLFMLTIGTFLGGIWANESWGRYWAWDPKEVWALVSVLVYAVILHLRYIPGAAGKFTFNVVSFWGYSAILFTFFGVNFYLVGLHSYAQGDGLGTVPSEIIYTVIVFILLTKLALHRNNIYTGIVKIKSWVKIILDYLILRTLIIPFFGILIYTYIYFSFNTNSDLANNDNVISVQFVNQLASFYFIFVFSACVFIYEVLKKLFTKKQ